MLCSLPVTSRWKVDTKQPEECATKEEVKIEMDNRDEPMGTDQAPTDSNAEPCPGGPQGSETSTTRARDPRQLFREALVPNNFFHSEQFVFVSTL